MRNTKIIIGLIEAEMKKEVKHNTVASIEYYIQSDSIENSDGFSKEKKLQELVKLHEKKKTCEERINKLEREIDSELFIEDFKSLVNKHFNF